MVRQPRRPPLQLVSGEWPAIFWPQPATLEQYDVLGATALAVVMLLLSFILLLTVNMLQWWTANRYKNNEPLELAAAKAAGGLA